MPETHQRDRRPQPGDLLTLTSLAIHETFHWLLLADRSFPNASFTSRIWSHKSSSCLESFPGGLCVPSHESVDTLI